MKKKEMDFSPVTGMLDSIIEDRTVPKNIRSSIEEAKTAIEEDSAIELKISSVISTLDDVINDPNMPMYTRTQIWNVVSMLEQMRKNI